MTCHADDMCAAYVRLCRSVLYYGDQVKRKGYELRELNQPLTLALSDPARNLVGSPSRNLNPWVTLSEFPWLLAGRNDIAWLQHYLPRATEFSDNGAEWRAGYGPRLRTWVARDGRVLDQVSYALTALPGRQAVINIWDPAEEIPAAGRTRDMPCTVSLMFSYNARHNDLSMTTVMRSNDLVWGLTGVNVFNFTTLQMAMADWAGYSVGPYYHIANNLHVYDRHGEMVKTGAEETEAPVPRPPYLEKQFGDSPRFFAEEAELLLGRLIERREDTWGHPDEVPAVSVWLRDWGYFMAQHHLRRDAAAIDKAMQPLLRRRPHWAYVANQYARQLEARRNG